MFVGGGGSSQWSTGGSLSIFYTSGNVGIGTTAPSYKLHVAGDIYATGDVTSFSDMRYKTNIQPLQHCLDRVQNISGVTYNFKADVEQDQEAAKRHIGFLAQEVEEQFPELVLTDSQGTKSVAYGNTVAVLLECIKELSSHVASINQRLNNLENK